MAANTSACESTRPVANTRTQTVKHPATDSVKHVHKKIAKPKPDTTIVEPPDTMTLKFPPTFKDKYTISLILPLYFVSINREFKEETPIRVSREFLKGVLVAADTLKTCGQHIDLHIFDSEKPWSQMSTEDTLKNNGTDLIIGPILDSHIYWMGALSKKDKINYVSSLQTGEECDNKDFYFQSIPSAENEAFAAAQLVKKQLKGYKIFLINEKKTKGNALAESFVKLFGADSVNIIDCNGKGIRGLPDNFPFADSNVVFIPSKYEVFVSSVMTQMRIATQKVAVIGPMQWQFFRTFEGDLWENLHVHLLSPYFMDYTNPALSGFIKKYRARYNEEPSVWSFFGFDEMAYYSGMLQRYGKYFQLKMNTLNTPMLHTTYRMRYNQGGCGWQNTYVNVLSFEDYTFKPVKP